MLGAIRGAWNEIEVQKLKRSLGSLYDVHLIDEKENRDGTLTITLAHTGRQMIMTGDLDKLKLPKPSRWSGKWYLVLYDVPEYLKPARDAFRRHLKRLGMYKLHDSVFVYPHDCFKEIKFLVGFWELGRYVRLVEAVEIDNEDFLRRKFGV